MRVQAWLLAMVLAFVAGAATWATPPGTADAAGCPTPPLTVAELRGLWGGEYAGFAGMTNPRARACYGRAAVRVIGYVDMPEGLGGTSASGIAPEWLTEWGLMLYGASDAVRSGHVNDSYVIAIPPKLGDLNEHYAHRWVLVTAHFDDPRAKTCHGWGVDPPTKKESVRICRSIMVLSSVSVTSAPDTATAGPRTPGDAPGPGAWPLLVVAAALGALATRTRERRVHRAGAQTRPERVLTERHRP